MLINILLLIILILINGIFSASEIAFLSINKFELNKLIKNNNKKAMKIDKTLNDTSTFLSTIQIAITLSGFLASAFAADTFTDEIMKWIPMTNISPSSLHSVILVCTTIILSYFSLVFGELIPKKIGMAYPLKVALIMITPLNIVKKICYPFIKLLSLSTNFFVKIFHIKNSNNNYSEEDIKKAIMNAENIGIIEKYEKELLLKVFEFNDTKVSDIMTPTKDVIFININQDIKEIISTIKTSKYTRFPVYENDQNNIIGILNVKDLIMHKTPPHSLRDILQPAKNIRYDVPIDEAFYIMKENHMGQVIVRYHKSVIGIITMEDIIEEIVGNIYDEYH